MKHSTQLIRSLLGLTVLLASCQVDDSLDILSDSEAQLFVSEACNYYEQTISEAAEKSKLVQNKNMSPGEVTLCWHKAHIKERRRSTEFRFRRHYVYGEIKRVIMMQLM